MSKFPIVIILDNIRSALNVGAIFRTCDGAGIQKLYLCGITPYPPHNRIPKTALGAIEYVEWERVEDTLKLIYQLQDEGYKVVSVEQSPNSKSYDEIKYEGKTAFVFGHEISGVDQDVMDDSDEIVEIPMYGKKNSLNVATSVGIITYNCISNLKK